MNKRNTTVVLGESKEWTNGSIKGLLEQRNIDVFECKDGIESIRKSFAISPDMVIVDVRMPRLNGYQLARILKNDASTKSIPIIHMGSSKNPIEQYWSKLCGADNYVQKPISEEELDRILAQNFQKKGDKSRLFCPVSTIPDLEDSAILSMANSFLEQDLLRANILNEITMLDITAMTTKELVTAAMGIIESLYDFTLGVVLVLYDYEEEIFFYHNGQFEETRVDDVKKFINKLENVKKLILKHIEKHHNRYIDPKQIKQNLIHSIRGKEFESELGELYIHTNEMGPIRTVLTFENIGIDELEENEQKVFALTLDLTQGILEKKIFFQMSQELSIIDAATQGYSMAFFMACLEREIENAVRNKYSMTLFTIALSNYEAITKNMSAKETHNLIRTVQHIIFKTMRKADIVARWDVASFAFLLTHTTAEKARIAQERISKEIKKELSHYLPSPNELIIHTGMSQFSPECNQAPEAFFSSAKPKETPKNEPFNESHADVDTETLYTKSVIVSPYRESNIDVVATP
ncbi:MAG: diguanylate cyclase [Thermodesulfobacteriota bacterium]|nr:diguanylate cyclase [Thermodesulfobacteriota bacterium]